MIEILSYIVLTFLAIVFMAGIVYEGMKSFKKRKVNKAWGNKVIEEKFEVVGVGKDVGDVLVLRVPPELYGLPEVTGCPPMPPVKPPRISSDEDKEVKVGYPTGDVQPSSDQSIDGLVSIDDLVEEFCKDPEFKNEYEEARENIRDVVLKDLVTPELIKTMNPKPVEHMVKEDIAPEEIFRWNPTEEDLDRCVQECSKATDNLINKVGCNVRVCGMSSWCEDCGLSWDTNDIDPPLCEKAFLMIDMDNPNEVLYNGDMGTGQFFKFGNALIKSGELKKGEWLLMKHSDGATTGFKKREEKNDV